MLPRTIARSVAAVVGLDNLVRLHPLDIVHPPRSTWGTRRKAVAGSFPHPRGAPNACPAARKAAQSFGGLTDDEIAHAYGAFGLYGAGDRGGGQRIALYELEPFLRSDIKVFDTCYFGASRAAKMLARVHVVGVDGGQPAGTGSGEALLDVEDLEGMAPGASIDVYEGPSPSADGVEYDPVDEYAAMIDNDRDRVISTSWGLCEQSIHDGQPGLQAAENLLFEQAAAQGQTIFSAAGDNGSDDCGPETATLARGQNPLSVDDPGSQPYVVSVGGTSIDDASGQRPVEQVWNDGGFGGAGGGGISESWTMPAWQRQATVPGIPKAGSADYRNAAGVERKFGYPTNFCQSKVSGATSATPCRVVPDVSSQARRVHGRDHVYQAAFGGWGPTGGTSSSTPIWAAMLAVSTPRRPALQAHHSRRRRFASPLLYAVASVPADIRAASTIQQGQQRRLRPRRRTGVPRHEWLRPGFWARVRRGSAGRATRQGSPTTWHARAAEPTGRHSTQPAWAASRARRRSTISGTGSSPAGSRTSPRSRLATRNSVPAASTSTARQNLRDRAACEGRSAPRFPCAPGRRRAGGGDRHSSRWRHKRAPPPRRSSTSTQRPQERPRITGVIPIGGAAGARVR